MPTNPNMVAIQTVTVGAGGAASISFSNIPQTYTDLVIQVSLRSTNASSTMSEYYGVYFNGSTSNLSYRRLYGNAGGAGSDNGTIVLVGSLPAAGFTANTFGSGQIYIPNYTSSNNKSFSTDNVAENNSSAEWETNITASLWSNTAAITSITIVPRRDNFAQYSTATLYGVTSAGYGAKATGGIITQDENYFYHTFLSSGTFTPTQSLSCDVMSVGGGGGGGRFGGGGGAGELDLFSTQSLTAQNYTVTIGAGGAGSTSYTANGSSGSTSSFGSLITSLGGGGGGRDGEGGGTGGSNGGSGGGGGKGTNGGTASGSNTFAGGNGGVSPASNVMGAGGGGGATAAGGNGVNVASTSATGGNGGAGYSLSNITNRPDIFGTMTVICSGGGGGAFCTSGVSNNPVAGTGGTGGGNGGTDKQGGTVSPTNATSFGSGGGGSGSSNDNGAAGYQGLVIVRYAK